MVVALAPLYLLNIFPTRNPDRQDFHIMNCRCMDGQPPPMVTSPGCKNQLMMRGMTMNIEESVKPAFWGLVCGGIATMVIGFSWGGWITTGTAGQMEKASATAAVIQEFTPLCVAKAEPQLEKLAALKDLSSWKHDDFVTEAGWVDNVSDQYRADVAGVCASTLIEGMKVG